MSGTGLHNDSREYLRAQKFGTSSCATKLGQDWRHLVHLCMPCEISQKNVLRFLNFKIDTLNIFLMIIPKNKTEQTCQIASRDYLQGL